MTVNIHPIQFPLLLIRFLYRINHLASAIYVMYTEFLIVNGTGTAFTSVCNVTWRTMTTTLGVILETHRLFLFTNLNSECIFLKDIDIFCNFFCGLEMKNEKSLDIFLLCAILSFSLMQWIACHRIWFGLFFISREASASFNVHSLFVTFAIQYGFVMGSGPFTILSLLSSWHC